MLSLKDSLGKHKLLRHSFLQYEVKNLITDYIATKSQSDIKFKFDVATEESRNNFKITISSQERTFVTWLKTELTELENFLAEKLIEKSLIPENGKVEIVFKSR